MADVIEILIVAKDLASGNIERARQNATRFARDVGQEAARAEQAVTSLGGSTERTATSSNRFSGALHDASRALKDAERGATDAERAVGGAASAAEAAGGGFEGMGLNIVKAGAGMAGMAAASYALVSAIGALTGGSISLIAALSELSALAVTIPAAFAAMGGAMAAALTIIKPAISPIAEFITAQEKAQAPTAATGGGGAGAAAGNQLAVTGAERQLAQARLQAVESVQSAERNLERTRQQNAWQERDAEQRIGQMRQSVVLNVLQLEERLAALRAANNQQQRQLELALADARASATGEAARGGAHSALAQAGVQEAQADLQTFQAQRASSEGQLVDQIVQAQLQGAQQVADAEEQLRRLRIQDAQQVADAERSLGDARRNAVNNVQSAEDGLTRARMAGASAASSQNAALAQQQALYAALSPLQRQIADQILTIKDRWEALTASARENVLHFASDTLQNVNQRLPQLAGTTSAFSNQLVGVGQFASSTFLQPAMFNRIDGYMRQIAKDAGEIGKALVNFGAAVTILVTSAGGRAFVQWLADGALAFSRFVLNSARLHDQQNGFMTFFTNAEKVVRNVADILYHVAHSLYEIGVAAAPSGRGMLGSIADAAKELDTYLGKPATQAAMRDFFENARRSLGEFAKAFGPFVQAFGGWVINITNANGPFMVFLQIAGKMPPIFLVWGAQMALMAKFIPGFNVLLKWAALGLWEIFAAISGVTLVTEAGVTTLTIFGVALEVAFLPLTAIIGVILAVGIGLYELYTRWDWFHKMVDRIMNLIWDTIQNHWELILNLLMPGMGFLVRFMIDHWTTIKDDAIGIWNTLVHTIPNKVGELADGISRVWGRVRRDASNVWSDIVGTVRHYVNDLIDGVNWVLSHIGMDKLPHWGQSGGNPTPLAHGEAATGRGMASGGIPVAGTSGSGIVTPVPGGVYRVAEAGAAEAVISLDPKYRDRSLSIIEEVLKRLGLGGGGAAFGDALVRRIAVARAIAQDLLPDQSIIGFAGGGIAAGSTLTSQQSYARRALLEAMRIDRLNLPYLWGGGHQSSPAPRNGPFDCSGFVSEVLQAAGINIPTMVSSGFMSWGAPGPGAIETFANAGHVYMGINGQFFGTSNYNPGGGPGRLPYGARPGFVVRHLPASGTGGFSLGDLLGGIGGAIGNIGGHLFSSIADAMRFVSARLPSVPSFKGDGIFGSIARGALRTVKTDGLEWLRHLLPFAEGGVVPGGWGAMLPVLAHGGEWILQADQQARVAQALGGWDRARQVLFQTPVPQYRMTGPRFTPGSAGAAAASGTTVHAPLTIHTTSADVDIDYVARVQQQRLAHIG